MGDSFCHVTYWLTDLSCLNDLDPNRPATSNLVAPRRPAKRKRSQQHLPSPSMSNHDHDVEHEHEFNHTHGNSLAGGFNMGSPDPKRPRHDGEPPVGNDAVIDPDPTPRSRRTQPISCPSISGTSSNASITGSKRTRSRRSSPTKNLALLQRDHIIEFQPFKGAKQCPGDLLKLRRSIIDDSSGLGIITAEDSVSISIFAETLPPNEKSLFDDLLESRLAVDTTDNRQRLGKLPPIAELRRIWAEAQYCEDNAVSEAHWNCAVQYPLLYAALGHANMGRGSGSAPTVGQSEVNLKLHNVSMAQIAQPYVPTSNRHQHGKRVDFCISIQPLQEPDRDAVKKAAATSAHDGINHTEYITLLFEPISVSIETKRTGEDWAEARHQMSVWLAAHWKRLDSLVLRRAVVGDGGSAELPDMDMAFLPGITIQGHDWFFIAATRGGEPSAREVGTMTDKLPQTVIWHKALIGSTENLRGIAQIIATVQRLAHWSAFTYWPWLKRLISP